MELYRSLFSFMRLECECQGDCQWPLIVSLSPVWSVQFVGCDGYLGSRKKEDVCRVCDGDNSTCRTVSGVFDKPLPKGGKSSTGFSALKITL